MNPTAKTVAWLVDELQRLVAEDPTIADRKVSMEGCDCYGDLSSVVVEKRYDPDEPGTVTLMR